MASDTTAFPIDEAQLVGLFMECVFYGMNIITAAMCLRVLLLLNDRLVFKTLKSINWTMVVVTILLLIISTMNVSFALRDSLVAFIFYQGPGGAKGHFSRISYWVNMMRTADYAAQTAVGDGILIYRTYVVWNRDKRLLVVPCTVWGTTLSCAIVALYKESKITEEALLDASGLVPFITSALVLTFSLNIILTSMIIFKLWRIRLRVAHHAVSGGQHLSHAIRLVLDSGLLYTMSVAVFFGTYAAKNNAQYGVSDCVVQIISITFNLIIIRSNRTYGVSQKFNSIPMMPSRPSAFDRKPGPPAVEVGVDICSVSYGDDSTFADQHSKNDTVLSESV